ncbi:MAG: hypothetical protein ABIK07_26100 [Planctomycetota bacterium]
MRRTILAIVSVLMLSLLFYLIITKESPDKFSKLLTQDFELLLPAGVKATEPQITKTDWSSTAEWTIDTDLSWKEYRTWLGKQIGGTYRVLSEGDGKVILRKTYHSEIHDIQLTAAEVEGKIHVVYRLSLW